MTHLLLSPRHTPDSQSLWRAALDLGWGVDRAVAAQWASGWVPEHEPNDVVLYGESMFVTSMAERLGISLVEPHSSVLVELPAAFVRRNITFTSLETARSMATMNAFPFFLKPAGEKAFPAKVYASLAELHEASDWADPELEVLASDPVVFEVEYRTFVANRAIEAASIYLRDGGLVDDDAESDATQLAAAMDFGNEVAQHIETTAYVLDVGWVRDTGWAVVELNPCWGAGLCRCDPRSVLTVLRQAMCVRPSM